MDNYRQKPVIEVHEKEIPHIAKLVFLIYFNKKKYGKLLYDLIYKLALGKIELYEKKKLVSTINQEDKQLEGKKITVSLWTFLGKKILANENLISFVRETVYYFYLHKAKIIFSEIK